MAKILLLLSHESNRRVLTEALPHHLLIDADKKPVADTEPDLIIIDFDRLQSDKDRLIRIRNTQSPTLVPVLLMLQERQLGLTKGALGREVDDVVFTPVLMSELLSRVRILSHLRQLSMSERQRERVASESHLQHVDRAYRILAACNEAAMRAWSEPELLNSVLASIVSAEGYRIAWIGFVRSGSATIEVSAVQSNSTAEDFDPAVILHGESRADPGPATQAVRESRAVIKSTCSLPSEDLAEKYSITTAVALPLFFDGGNVGGVLTIYSNLPDAFHPDEIALLQNLADNTAFGISTLRNRTRLEEQRSLAQNRAYRDSLTGLPNRQYLKEQLTKLDSGAERRECYAALLFVDLDGFKRINDSLGHGIGDQLLRLVAERLEHLARGEDFVARLGGDEFVFLINRGSIGPVTSAEARSRELARAATLLAERLVESMKLPFKDGVHEHHLGVSVGISLFPEDTRFATHLLNCADMAMYKAKSSGGNQFQFYSPSLTVDQHQRLQLEHELHRALDQDQLMTHYQPIVNLSNGKVDFIEALMRWRRDDGSLARPGEFLKALEETGLIARAGVSLFRESCRALMRCRALQPELRLAVNLSINQLWNPQLLDEVRAVMVAEEVPSGAVIIEVMEDALVRGNHRMEHLLQHLNQMGFDVALDDFGTGYSSLVRLKELPLTMLKLDKVFLQDLNRDSSDSSMVKTIRHMADFLEVTLVAEGVETETQCALLRELDYGYGQGFFFGAPMPEAELEPLLRHGVAWPPA
ncbi:MAG: EAL domain-containing protein [Oleiphilaceae bacterium]|nr:EAL domain-containing protein [Oleiphilaceae bacterium]